MVFPVNGPKGPNATDKAKAKAPARAAGGTSFAELLSAVQTQESPEAAPLPTPMGLGGYVPLPSEEELIPADTRGQTAQLLKTLRDLAQAAMGGSQQANIQRLQALSEAAAADGATLTPQQQQAVNETRTRAAVEAAKITKS